MHDSAVPVDVFSGQAVETASTTGDVGQILQARAPPINFPHVSLSGSPDSVRPVILCGLAPDQVLVLVNGKRRHVSAVLATEGPFVGTVPVLGIPEWDTSAIDQSLVTAPDHIWSLDEVLDSAHSQPAFFLPGQGFAYSNTNYMLLGEILSHWPTLPQYRRHRPQHRPGEKRTALAFSCRSSRASGD